MTYTETRTLSSDSVRELCIEKKWYTCGTNEEYTALLTNIENADHWSMCFSDNVTTQALADWAEDIKAHSHTEYEVTNIMYELAKACITTFSAR